MCPPCPRLRVSPGEGACLGAPPHPRGGLGEAWVGLGGTPPAQKKGLGLPGSPRHGGYFLGGASGGVLWLLGGVGVWGQLGGHTGCWGGSPKTFWGTWGGGIGVQTPPQCCRGSRGAILGTLEILGWGGWGTTKESLGSPGGFWGTQGGRIGVQTPPGRQGVCVCVAP